MHAKLLLEPMILGVRSGIPVFEQLVIARWLALKTLVADLDDHGYPTFKLEDYHAFHDDPNPPERFMRGSATSTPQARTTHSSQPAPLVTSETIDGVHANAPHALEFALSLGPVYLQAALVNRRTAAYPTVPILGPSPWWSQVWPQDRGVVWPPPFAITPEMLPNEQGNWPEAAEWMTKKVRRPRRHG